VTGNEKLYYVQLFTSLDEVEKPISYRTRMMMFSLMANSPEQAWMMVRQTLKEDEKKYGDLNIEHISVFTPENLRDVIEQLIGTEKVGNETLERFKEDMKSLDLKTN
jgi:hypothetical protein